MKFKIKYADQIVGFFSILAMAAIIVLIFAIGANKNWFTKKNRYFTVFDSGSGLSVGMDLTYKGFSIGKISSVDLIGNFVRVDFYVLEDYFDYVRENSVVSLDVSPIGLGSSFTLYQGKGKSIIPDGSEIFRMNSIPAQQMIDDGLVMIPDSSDSISVLLGKVSGILDDVHELLGGINDAIYGTGDAPLTQILRNAGTLTGNLADLENGAVPNLLGEDIARSLTETLNGLSAMMNDSKGAVPQLLGEQMTGELNSILRNLTPILSNADTLVGNATPEVGELLGQVNSLLVQVQDLVTGLNNNPLLRGGIPDRSNEKSAPVTVRGGDF